MHAVLPWWCVSLCQLSLPRHAGIQTWRTNQTLRQTTQAWPVAHPTTHHLLSFLCLYENVLHVEKLYNINLRSSEADTQKNISHKLFPSGETCSDHIHDGDGSFAHLRQLVFSEHYYCIVQVVDLLVEVTLTEVGEAWHSHWGEPQGMEDMSPQGSDSLLPSHLPILWWWWWWWWR